MVVRHYEHTGVKHYACAVVTNTRVMAEKFQLPRRVTTVLS